MKVRLIGHECVHVLQFLGKILSMEHVKDPQAAFAWDYVHDQESRAFLEAEAYAADQEIAYQLWGEEPDPSWVEESLRGAYAIAHPYAAFAKRLLDVRKRVTVTGNYSAPVTKHTVEFFKARYAA